MTESTCVIDFETYSNAGWENSAGIWKVKYGKQNGLKLSGVHVYASHPSTRILCMGFQFPGESKVSLWTPDSIFPEKLISYIKNGLLIEAHNAGFEYNLWNYCLAPRYNLPLLDLRQMRCSSAKAKAYGLPSHLAYIPKAIGVEEKKDTMGTYLIELFSIPQKNTPVTRIYPYTKPKMFEYMCNYCIQDVLTQRAISREMPDLLPEEQKLWELTTLMNTEGLTIDVKGVENCIQVMEEITRELGTKLPEMTDGVVTKITQGQRIVDWIDTQGIDMPNLQKATVTKFLEKKLPEQVRNLLKIRQATGLSSVKKLYAIQGRLKAGKIFDNYWFHGADTGRFTGEGPQLQNIPRKGNTVHYNTFFKLYHDYGELIDGTDTPVKWDSKLLEFILHNPEVIKIWKRPLKAISGALRGLIIASPGCDFICSDYSSIEAVVLSMLAGEKWREELFRTGKDIYIASGSMITKTPIDQITKEHKARAIGKLVELASGYQGWIGAWKKFSTEDTLNEEEIKRAILTWRANSPNIVELWGGQHKKYNGRWVNKYYGLEGAAITAIQNPHTVCTYRHIQYWYNEETLTCVLPSGRKLYYHTPWLTHVSHYSGLPKYQINYMRELSGAKDHWGPSYLYGGKLAENVTQATARDIFTAAMLRIHRAGYKIVLHTHDEIMIEVPEGTCSVEELERLMGIKEPWFSDWPIRAAGGWRGKRYRK